MTVTLRNPVDGSTVDADPADKARLARLADLGYLVVGKPALSPAKKAVAKKAVAKKK